MKNKLVSLCFDTVLKLSNFDFSFRELTCFKASYLYCFPRSGRFNFAEMCTHVERQEELTIQKGNA